MSLPHCGLERLAIMFPYVSSSATQMLRLTWSNAMMMAEAQAVIGMRLFGMMGLWPVSSEENSRMISEKFAAIQEGQAAAVKAALQGGDATKVMEAAMRPVRRRTKANVKRLSKLPKG